ncbi:phage tail protein [Pantoea endophytica]|uniref:Phage tail protein n=1 Tax=Pantoea endophytica TaxID=92488 RepID=A0ABX4SSH2_9GAMM|nr:tail fiber assembly protein [Pantoea endophytica]PLR23218.1 phage tail protein [Pantoea endophytica]
MKKYSAKANAFYDADINPVIPADAVNVTDEEWMSLLSGQSTGLIIAADSDGRPVLKEYVLTDEEKSAQLDAKKRELRTIADDAIAPLQDAATLGIATDDENASLKAWMTYRVLLNRIDTKSGGASEIIWPEQPA